MLTSNPTPQNSNQDFSTQLRIIGLDRFCNNFVICFRRFVFFVFFANLSLMSFFFFFYLSQFCPKRRHDKNNYGSRPNSLLLIKHNKVTCWHSWVKRINTYAFFLTIACCKGYTLLGPLGRACETKVSMQITLQLLWGHWNLLNNLPPCVSFVCGLREPCDMLSGFDLSGSYCDNTMQATNHQPCPTRPPWRGCGTWWPRSAPVCSQIPA